MTGILAGGNSGTAVDPRAPIGLRSPTSPVLLATPPAWVALKSRSQRNASHPKASQLTPRPAASLSAARTLRNIARAFCLHSCLAHAQPMAQRQEPTQLWQQHRCDSTALLDLVAIDLRATELASQASTSLLPSTSYGLHYIMDCARHYIRLQKGNVVGFICKRDQLSLAG